MKNISLDVLILSNTINDIIYEMNVSCIDSLFESESFDKYDISVLLIESNKESSYVYRTGVQLIVPDGEFNYNKYINIGLSYSNSDFVALCNNDIIFYKNWFSEIVKFHNQNNDVLSFSPFDRTNKYTPSDEYKFPFSYFGFGVRKEVAGWCIVVKRKIFNIIGSFDEMFDFYYVDDDYAMTLRKYALKHVLLTNSEVKHLGGKVSQAIKKNCDSVFNLKIDKNVKIGCENDDDWLLKNQKALDGHLKFHKKWGGMRTIAMKNRLFKYLSFLNRRWITKICY